MSMTENVLISDFQQLKAIHYANPNFVSEMTALVASVNSDSTTHSAEIETPIVALRVGADKSRLQNDALLLINNAKAGNMTKFQIIAAMDDALAIAHAPANVTVPYASANASPAIVGTIVSVTVGNWTSTPTSYTYQWKRDGVTNLGTAASYTLIAADVGGHAIACVVTAINATGSTAAPLSNAIAT